MLFYIGEPLSFVLFESKVDQSFGESTHQLRIASAQDTCVGTKRGPAKWEIECHSVKKQSSVSVYSSQRVSCLALLLIHEPITVLSWRQWVNTTEVNEFPTGGNVRCVKEMVGLIKSIGTDGTPERRMGGKVPSYGNPDADEGRRMSETGITENDTRCDILNQ
eukprot:GHVN01056940.1.p1 GENE.GHVN01056940.1~~GHVN01056940.1.p1  ORF type:complete len:163 (+),score=22.62 GHVN01056940.1:1800-2288(+)